MKVKIEMGKGGVTIYATVKRDGNQYCVIGEGDCLADMPAGFGYLVMEAIENYKDTIWRLSSERNYERT